ncbi:hypothetical protein M1N20_02000 [Dehalococcoidia bacterium]|nr:hypothetical protein [Dehalococcoidia bacterium]
MEQRTLEQQVWNEQAILELLGINRKQLDYLRLEKDFPCARLGPKIRLYLADDVLEYIEQATGHRKQDM